MRLRLSVLLALLLFVFSCVRDTESSSQDASRKSEFNPEAVWEYSGDSEVIKTVISELRKSPGANKLSRKIWKRDLLWEKASFRIVNNRKRLLVPLLNNKKDKVIGILQFNKGVNNIVYHLIERKDLYKEDALSSMWSKGTWLGYMKALDATILGNYKNSPGLSKRQLTKSEKQGLASRWDEVCTQYEIEECFYLDFYDGSGEYLGTEEQQCTISYEEECDYEWVDEFSDGDDDPCDYDYDPCVCDGDCGETGGGSGTGTTCKGCDEEDDKVFNELEGEAKCVFDKLKSINGNLFKEVIGGFINDPNYNLTIKEGQCTNTDDACTDVSNVNNIVINIEDIDANPIQLAQYILHEGVHAELYRYVSRYESGVDPNDKPRLFQLFRHYNELYGTGDIQHIYMTEKYINPLASALRQLDGNKYPTDYYKAFAWDGLRFWDANKLLGMEENSEYERYRRIVIENTTLCEGE